MTANIGKYENINNCYRLKKDGNVNKILTIEKVMQITSEFVKENVPAQVIVLYFNHKS